MKQSGEGELSRRSASLLLGEELAGKCHRKHELERY
jgi:hypothetical protein